MKLLTGDSRDKLKELEDNSIDALVTDPPYLINFMGKDWDKENSPAGDPSFWEEVIRVMKPGAYGVVFGHSRQHHRVMTALEDAGFEIRDCLMWLYGSGFPKNHNISIALDKTITGMKARGKRNNFGTTLNTANDEGLPAAASVGKHEPISEEAKKWDGWGTALKPAYEPIILVRKPLEKKLSVAKNIIKWGTGGINIDASRIGTNEDFSNITPRKMMANQGSVKTPDHDHTAADSWQQAKDKLQNLGRFPANVLLDPVSAEMLDKQAPSTGNAFQKTRTKNTSGGSGNSWTNGGKKAGEDNGVFDGLSGASRFFYCAKVSKKERNAGCDAFEEKEVRFRATKNGTGETSKGQERFTSLKKNTHPTVKPIKLMTYLAKLITPEGGVVLDPFMGSGSTGMACAMEGFDFIGIEMDPHYVEISQARINWARTQNKKEENKEE